MPPITTLTRGIIAQGGRSHAANEKETTPSVIGKKRVVLLVHANWCPHCVKLMERRGPGGRLPSIWETVKRDMPDVTFLDVEYEEYQDIMRKAPGSAAGTLLKETVSGFPCLFIVDKLKRRQMDVRHFEGAKRDVRTIKAFVNKHYFSEAM